MGVLLMLMTTGGSIVASILFVIALYTGKAWLAKFVFGGTSVWFAFYFALLLGVSFLSEEKTLELNEPKAYCGFYLDCHMHTAVKRVRTAKTIGNKTAKGEFHIVTVEVFSDAVRATLGLLTVDAHVVDAGNRTYTRDMGAETQLAPQPDFEKQIGPEESFEKEIVFDLPVNVKEPRLDLREGIGIDSIIESFLIGDEDSIFHKRNYFKLSEQNDLAGVK
ncbi:MAG: hypothetical protein WBD27_15225 [Pyrinomonadaceae bacterium]